MHFMQTILSRCHTAYHWHKQHFIIRRWRQTHICSIHTHFNERFVWPILDGKTNYGKNHGKKSTNLMYGNLFGWFQQTTPNTIDCMNRNICDFRDAPSKEQFISMLCLSWDHLSGWKNTNISIWSLLMNGNIWDRFWLVLNWLGFGLARGQ